MEIKNVEMGKIEGHDVWYPIVDGHHCVSITVDSEKDFGKIVEIIEEEERIREAISEQKEGFENGHNHGISFYMAGFDGKEQERHKKFYAENYGVEIF